MTDQEIRANVNVLGPARLAAQLLDFGESCVVAVEAYFLAVMGWAYWADYPTVSSYDISGMSLDFTPGSIGAAIAALCWGILSNASTFAGMVTAGRADDLTGTVAAFCAWRPDLTSEINANLAILAPRLATPEGAPKAIEPVETVALPASGISAASDTPRPVVDAPTPASASPSEAPSPVQVVPQTEPVATPVDPYDASPVATDSPPVTPEPVLSDVPMVDPVDNRPHVIALAGDSFWSLGLKVGISAEAVKRCNPGMASPMPGSMVYLA